MSSSSSISDKFAYYALRLSEIPFGIIPTSWMWRFGASIGFIAHSLAKKRRSIVRANLKIIHPEFTDTQIDSLAKKVFRNSFGNLAAALSTGCISPDRFKTKVTTSGLEQIKNLSPEHGCIMLAFHMGNWEILSRAAHYLDTDKPLASMYRPLNNPLLNDHITRIRKQDGAKLFGRKQGLIEACKFLRDGGILGILGDQHSGNAGVKLSLFGKETSITPLPAILAQKYNCPVIPIIIQTVSPGKWHVQLKQPISIAQNLNKSEATQLLIPHMEAIMRECSADIFWLHDLWKIKHQL